jgi:GGDEF domain-containing protein
LLHHYGDLLLQQVGPRLEGVLREGDSWRALSPRHGTDFDELLQHADIAMYAAKTSGEGFKVYAPETDDTYAW